MEQQIKELLSRIVHPETEQNIVQSGIVESVTAREDKIGVVLCFPKVKDPFAQRIRTQVEQLLKFQVEGKEDTFMILEEQISTEPYGVGFKLDNDALKNEVESVLMEMVDDGTFAKISEKWFGLDVCTLK